jgi:cytoskeletal protein RodZ
MQKQSVSIIVAVIVTAIVVGGGVYLWQRQQTPTQESIELSNLENIPSVSGENQVGPEYVNQNLKFSLQIPDGYIVDKTSENTFQIVSRPTSENETPLPEVNIKVGNLDDIKSDTIIKEENVEIGGVAGKKFNVSFGEGQCPVYRFDSQSKIYEFSLYECLESNIFEDVVKSFRIISE